MMQNPREVLLAIDANYVVRSLESKLRMSSIFLSKTLGAFFKMLCVRSQYEKLENEIAEVSEE